MGDKKQEILDRILAEIPSKYDKSANSMYFHNAGALATELEPKYAEQSNMLDQAFAETATLDNLKRIAANRGLIPPYKEAVASTNVVKLTGTIGATAQVGDRISSDLAEFEVTTLSTIEALGYNDAVPVRCITPGIIGNVPIGAIKYFPVGLSGITTVTNEVEFTNGFDAETKEELLNRYYEKIRTPATSGNPFHYKGWAKEVVGIKEAKVLPLWAGNGTVKVVLIDSNGHPADAGLVTDVTNNIEANRPIGATVTVIPATGLNIDVSATLELLPGPSYTLIAATNSITSNITSYLKDIAFVEDSVSYAIIGSLILGSYGVKDYSALTVNAGTSNVVIPDESVAVVGTITMGV